MGTLHETNPSLWVDTTRDAPTFLPFAPIGDVPIVDVAVVGAGVSGLSTALAIAERGASVVVVEAGRISSGTTGYTTAKVTSLHGLTYAGLCQNRGRDVAASYLAANDAGIDQARKWVDDYRIECDLETRDAYTYTTTPSRVAAIEAEVAALQDLGAPARFTTETELPFDVLGAVSLPDQAQFHPRRYCAGLAAAIVARGGEVHEDTRVLDVDASKDGEAIVRTEHGDLRARFVVLATQLPFLDRGGFFAKAYPSRSYAMAARLSEGARCPQAMYLAKDDPTRSLRTALDGDVLIIGGEAHKVGQEPDTRRCYDSLEKWARENFDIDTVEQRWSAQDYVPVDGTPFVGRQLPGSDVFVATGFQKWGMTNGTAAGMLLADLIDGRQNPWLPAYDATRIKNTVTSKAFVKENVDAGIVHLAGDRLKTLNPPHAESLAPGEGGIVLLDGRKVAAYRRPDGSFVALSAACSHLGCLVGWNTAEKSWDCPCHGSRYSADGKVINGPALHDLAPLGENGDDSP